MHFVKKKVEEKRIDFDKKLKSKEIKGKVFFNAFC